MKYFFLLLLSFPLLATPELELAIRQKDHEAVRKLLASGAVQSDDSGTMEALAKEGDEKMLLLFNPSSPKFPERSFMHFLGKSENMKLLSVYYKFARPSVRGIGLFYFIKKHPIKELEIFRDLAKKDIMSSMHLSLIHEACESTVDQQEKLEFLEKMGFTFTEADKKGVNALHYFVANEGKNFSCVDFYLKKGVPINAADKSGRTALHRAHTIKTFDYLVKKGAKKNIMDNRGHLPERREVPDGDFFGKERKTSLGQGLFN